MTRSRSTLAWAGLPLAVLLMQHAGEGAGLTLCSPGWFRSLAAVLGPRLLYRERGLGGRLTTMYSEEFR